MTTEPAAASATNRWLKIVLRWGVAIVILWFLVERLARDWPTVSAAWQHVEWVWIGLSVIPAFGYFAFRVQAWREILSSLKLPTPFALSARVWMNGEIARYVPGNVWSVVGRISQAFSIGASRTLVFSSMVLEVLVLLAAVTLLSALLLMTYPRFEFPGRWLVLILVAVFSLAVAARRVARGLTQIVFRLLRRHDAPPSAGHPARAFSSMVLAWLCFAGFHVLVALGLQIDVLGIGIMTVAGATLLSWLLGYVSFLTPSGLGVREAAMVWLFAPFVSVPQAIVFAVISRMAMTLVEVIGLVIANLVTHHRRQ